MYSFYGSNAVDATTAAFIRIRDIIRVANWPPNNLEMLRVPAVYNIIVI